MPEPVSGVPVTHYARAGDFHIAYQVVGAGELDIVFVPALWSHVEAHWEQPLVARFLRRLATFGRLIIFDVAAVMDAAGGRRAVLMAHSGGCHMSMLFAAAHPERVSHLILGEPGRCFRRLPQASRTMPR